MCLGGRLGQKEKVSLLLGGRLDMYGCLVMCLGPKFYTLGNVK